MLELLPCSLCKACQARNALILPKLIATVTNIIKPKGADQPVVLAIMPSRPREESDQDPLEDEVQRLSAFVWFVRINQ